jgi:hypothetical protein
MGLRPDLAERNRSNATHKMTKTPTYRTWSAMKDRCTKPGNKDYPRYGAKGINVCETWIHSFESFIEHMGERPKGLSIDRIDNARGYEPGNCRWATPKQQATNRRSTVFVEFNGETLSVAMWSERMGLERKTLEYRIRTGWNTEKALTTPSTIKRK